MSGAARHIKEKRSLLPENGPVPNRRILVLDDEPAIGEAIRGMLSPQAPRSIRRSSRSVQEPVEIRAAEFDVTVVQTPAQAIDAVTFALREGRPYAVGFFDVMLGAEIDGIELVKQIFSVDDKMFAVFVTAYQDRTVDTIGGFLGEQNRERWDYINKPFTEGEILQKARNASSLWDLHRLKAWQEERLSEANRQLLFSERQNTVAAVGRSVAHEFGNLLTHIVGNAELALAQDQADNMRSSLELILRASDTAASILSRFRRLHDSDEAGPVHAEFNLCQVLDEALELLEFQFRKYYIRVEKPTDKQLMITGNRHAFVQVFVNLFLNSMHAMPDGGKLRIEFTTVEGAPEIHVRDSGVGIAKENLDRVTEALFTTKGKEGSGLGLAICKEIVEIEHGGELRIANYFEGGVEVIIRLRPVRKESA